MLKRKLLLPVLLLSSVCMASCATINDQYVDNQDIIENSYIDISLRSVDYRGNNDYISSATFSYVLLPSTMSATSKFNQIDASVKFSDNSSGADQYVSYNVDTANKEVTVYLNQTFSTTIIMTLTSHYLPTISGNVTLHCNPHFKLGMNTTYTTSFNIDTYGNNKAFTYLLTSGMLCNYSYFGSNTESYSGSNGYVDTSNPIHDLTARAGFAAGITISNINIVDKGPCDDLQDATSTLSQLFGNAMANWVQGNANYLQIRDAIDYEFSQNVAYIDLWDCFGSTVEFDISFTKNVSTEYLEIDCYNPFTQSNDTVLLDCLDLHVTRSNPYYPSSLSANNNVIYL